MGLTSSRPKHLHVPSECKTNEGVYLFHSGFFDIHPPLGKLILGYGGYLLGYRPDPDFVIQKIGHVYPEHVKYVLKRFIAAVFSIATVPNTYMIARTMGMFYQGAVLSTIMVLFDFLGIIEGRLILMDSQLLFFCQLSLLCALILWRTRPGSWKRFGMLIITGVMSGSAFSIKHTALATPALIAIVSFLGIHFLDMPLEIWECALAGICGLVVYVIPFYIIFRLSQSSGGKYDAFMPLHFKKTLLGSKEYDPTATRASFHRLFLYLNKRMVVSNANIKKRHNWESRWYHWVLNWRGVLYYVFREEKEGIKYKTLIYLMGNPVIIYIVLICVVLFVLVLCLSIRYRGRLERMQYYKKLRLFRANGVFLLCGWLCNLLPYMLVDRASFIYHYLPGLFYGQLLCGLLCDALPPKLRLGTVTVIIALIVAAYVYWSPWIYALTLTEKQHTKRRWLPRWN